jgi:hypothetical protein
MRIQALLVAALFTAALPHGGAQATAGKMASPPASAQSPVPALVPFSGVAAGVEGKPLTAETAVTFLIYRDEQGGEPLWTETQSVQPDATGHYKVQLGAATGPGLPLELFASGDARWLEVQIAGQRPQPRIMLISVPYALKAADAATLGGLPASAFALAGSAAAGTPAASARPETTPVDVTTSGGTVDYLPMFDSSSDLTDSPVFVRVINGNQYLVGINTSQPTDYLDVNGGMRVRGGGSFASGLSVDGDIYVGTRPTGNSWGLFFTTSNGTSETFGWHEEPNGSDDNSPSGSLNLLYGPYAGTTPETGFHFNSDGTMHFAPNQTFPIKGTGGGTVTSVATGAGLAGGPITTSGTLSIANGGVTNAMLASPSLSVTPGTGLTGGGSVSLGGASPALKVDSSVVPLLSGANTFTGPNTFNGSLTASQIFSQTLAAVTTMPPQAILGVQKATSGPVAGGYFESASPQGAGLVAANSGGGNAGWFQGPVLLQSTSEATSRTSAVSSPPLTLGMSTWSSTANKGSGGPVSPVFQWQAVATPAATSSGAPTTTLNLLYGAGTATSASPKTIFSINPNGTLNFAPGQTLKGISGVGTITGVTAGTGLTGGGTTGAVTLNVDSNQVPLFSTFNTFPDGYTFLSDQSFSGNIQVGGQVGAATVNAQTSSANQAVYGYNGAGQGAVSGGNFQAATTSPQGSALMAVNTNASGGGNAGLFQGAVALLPVSGATPSAPANSSPLALQTAAWSAASGAAVNPAFQWEAEATGNGTASPSATLNLLYNAGTATSTPGETGLQVSSKGIITFAPHQAFPIAGTGGGTITGITTASPLTGSGTSGSVALGLNTAALTTTLNGSYAQLHAANLFVGNQTVIGGLNVEGGQQGYSGAVSALSLTATNTAASTNAVYGAAMAKSGSSNGGYFSSASPAGSGVVGINTAGGNAGYFEGNVSVTGNATVSGTLTSTGAFQAPNLSATTGAAGASAVQGASTAATGTSNGGFFASASPAGSGIVAANTAGGNAGYFQGPVTVTGAVQAASVGATSPAAGASAVQGASTAATGTSNGGFFTSASPTGSGIVAANSAGGNAGFFQGPVVVTGNTATGQLGIGGDKPMSHNPRMSFSGFIGSFPGFGNTALAIGGYFVPDQNITITRVTVSEGSAGSNCGNNPDDALIYVWDSAHGGAPGGGPALEVEIDLGQNTNYVDSGPVAYTANAGDQIKILGSSAYETDLGVTCQSPGNVFINVEYTMR